MDNRSLYSARRPDANWWQATNKQGLSARAVFSTRKKLWEDCTLCRSASAPPTPCRRPSKRLALAIRVPAERRRASWLHRVACAHAESRWELAPRHRLSLRQF